MLTLDEPSTSGGGAAGRPAGPAAATPEVTGGSWGEALAALLADLAGPTDASEAGGVRPPAGRLAAPPSPSPSNDAEESTAEPDTAAGEPHDDMEWRAVPLPLVAAWLTPPAASASKTPETVCFTSGGAAEDGSRQPAPQPAGGAVLAVVPVQPAPGSPVAAGRGHSTQPYLAVVRDLSDAAGAPPSPPPAGTYWGSPPEHAHHSSPEAGATAATDAGTYAGGAPAAPVPSVSRGCGMAETEAGRPARMAATPDIRPPSGRPRRAGSEAVPALEEDCSAAEPSNGDALVGVAESPPAVAAGDDGVAVAPAAGRTAQPPDPAPPARTDVEASVTAPASQAAREGTPAPLAFAARLVGRTAGPARVEASHTTLAASAGERSPWPAATDAAGPPAVPSRRGLPARATPAAAPRPERSDTPSTADSAGRLPAETGPDAAKAELKPSGAPLSRLPGAVSAAASLEAAGPREERPADRAAAAWRSGETQAPTAVPAPGRHAPEANDVPPDRADVPRAAQAVAREHRDAAPAAPPAGELRLRLDRTPEEPRVEVRVTERGGEVRVSVRTPDAGLSQDLRQALPELIDSLDRRGYHTEIWRPGEADAAAPQRGEPRRTDAEPAGGQGFGNRDSAAGQGEPDPDRDRRPPAEAWEEAWHTTQRQWDGRTAL